MGGELFGLFTGIALFGLGCFFLGLCLQNHNFIKQNRRIRFYQGILRSRANGARGPVTGFKTAGH